ncbi:PREDICTED: uncharacterized protein LOC104824931 [Tarenaya hassleriana]|uniref:uncharacterized protein LOC104824931 n=1 Tax=Tarenaya hassleriana TaxID=28532 RepID=UPI00053C2C32|nr:PREDICTED: uncharacterized protein LOC104824931 [Tarenaya hassleriana]
MAPTQRPPENISAVKPPKLKPPPRVCFSFAAYSKTIIRHLRSLNVDVLPGLTDDEISAVESSLDFSFPPDLRSILQAGLPLGAHFPDWRTGSTHHLRILFNLPLLHLSKNVARNGFWVGSWGPRPKNDVAALSVVKKLSDHAPVLIPVYGNCYLPSTTPNLAGNPVIQIDGNGVKVLSIDVSGIFMRFDRLSNPNGSRILPVWAAKETRRVEFWSEVAERGRRTTTARGPTLGWWSALPDECLTACLDDAFWKLRDGGWSEDEVRDMMNGDDAISDGVGHGIRRVIRRRITDAAQTLSRAGWSREDVEYALDHRESCGCDRNVKRNHDRSACDGERCPSTSCCMGKEEGHQKRGEITTLMYLLSLEA